MDNRTDETAIQMTAEQEKQREQVKELMRRGRVKKYFFGPGDFRSGEGFGYVVGGIGLLLFGGVLLPQLFGGHGESGYEYYFYYGMGGIGLFMLLKGIYEIYKERGRRRQPVSDQEYDEIFQGDVELTRRAGEAFLRKTFALPEETSFLHCHFPIYYSSSKNLPIVWKTGEDGFIRYSNFALLSLAFSGAGEESRMFAYTSIFNCRNGTLRFERTYEYETRQITKVEGRDVEVDRLTEENTWEPKNLAMLLIGIEGREDVNELAGIARDYGVMEKKKGVFDTTHIEQFAERLLEKLNELKA